MERAARAVVIATGAYDVANDIGVPGENLPHVSHYYREAHPYYRRRVVIVGGKNSAAEAALELYRAGAHGDHRPPAAGTRRVDQVLGEARHREPDSRGIRARAVQYARPRDHAVRRAGGRARRPPREPADAVLLMTGYRSDTSLLGMAGAAHRRGRRRAHSRSEHVRDHRAQSLRRRRRRRRAAERAHLHRERTIPRGSRDRRLPIGVEARSWPSRSVGLTSGNQLRIAPMMIAVSSRVM